MINPMKPKHRRAAEAQGTNFRVFREFRGSSFSLTILLSFALLLAAAPARAQSPAILLDIKSPATASPPNESLLTLDDAGDLWIKGQLYDYAFQTTITLDPARQYWTLRDTTGKIVWALEVHNPGTGISTGDLYSIGSVRGWMTNPSQSGDLLRFANAAGSTVFALSASGNAAANGSVPGTSSAPPVWVVRIRKLRDAVLPVWVVRIRKLRDAVPPVWVVRIQKLNDAVPPVWVVRIQKLNDAVPPRVAARSSADSR